MKSFYGLLSLIISMLVFSACSDSSTGNAEFESYQIGNWRVSSETQADYAPESAQSIKGTANSISNANPDTVHYKEGVHEIVMYGYLYKNEELPEEQKDRFHMTFTDLSATQAFLDSTDARRAIALASPVSGLDVDFGGSTLEKPANIDFDIAFSCDSTYTVPENEQLEFRLMKDTSFDPDGYQIDEDGNINDYLHKHTYRYYSFDATGLLETATELMCN